MRKKHLTAFSASTKRLAINRVEANVRKSYLKKNMRILTLFLITLLVATTIQGMELRSGTIIPKNTPQQIQEEESLIHYKITMAVKDFETLEKFKEGILNRTIIVACENGICSSIFIIAKAGINIPLLKQPQIIKAEKYTPLETLNNAEEISIEDDSD